MAQVIVSMPLSVRLTNRHSQLPEKSVKTNKRLPGLMMLTLCLLSDSNGFPQVHDDIKLTGYYRSGSAETLVHHCKSVENANLDANTIPIKDAGDLGYCFGFISGIVDLNAMDEDILKKPSHAWCIPSSVSPTQLAKVVLKYGNDHPEELHFPGVVVVASALVVSFPCHH